MLYLKELPKDTYGKDQVGRMRYYAVVVLAPKDDACMADFIPNVNHLVKNLRPVFRAYDEAGEGRRRKTSAGAGCEFAVVAGGSIGAQ